MKTLTQPGTIRPNFIHLKDLVRIEYEFIYHINDGYSIDNLRDFSSKNQLLFQRLGSKQQQMNLMMVDSIFPILLSDAVIDIFLYGVNSFSQYVDRKNNDIVVNTQFASGYVEYKLKQFIYFLLFSDLNLDAPFHGHTDNTKVYYLKNGQEEVCYYSIYDLKELQCLLVGKMKLTVNRAKSYILKQDAHLFLEMRF